jgi:uncharacterized membrane protein HdeD (DUF308 family)
MSDQVTSTITRKADWAIFMGVLTTVIGTAMIVHPMATATVTTFFFGGSLVVAAMATFIFAFYSSSPGPFFVKGLLSIVYAVAGIGLLVNPALGVATLTIALGTMLVCQSFLEFATAISYRNVIPWGGLAVSSLLSLALGLMILFQWPFSSTWAIGTMVGVGVLSAGITRIVVAGAIHDGARKFDKLVNA